MGISERKKNNTKIRVKSSFLPSWTHEGLEITSLHVCMYVCMYVRMYVLTSLHHKIFWLDFQQKLMLKSRNYFVTCMYVCMFGQVGTTRNFG